jgi:membrane fusion protein (multidrug efflux system)
MKAFLLRSLSPLQLGSARCRRALLLITVLAFGLITGCGREEGTKGAPEPPAVGVIEVSKQKVNPFYEFIGKTRAAETVALRARVTGFLEERDFQEGGQVEKGQVLFRIEPEQYRATLAQTEAALGAAQASLERARVDLTRYEELAKAKNVSQQKVDEAKAEVLVQEAAVRTAKADIEKAQLNVDYTEITAPIDGRIDVAAYTVGNLIGPDSGVLATINQMDPIKVAFSIAETWYLDIMKENLAHQRERGDGGKHEPSHVPRIRLADGTMYEHDGELDFIDNKVDEKTGTVLVRAVFDNPDGLLLPGQFITVVIEREEALDAIVIPQAAVLTDQGGAYVLLVNDEDKVEARRIETGQRFGPNLVVTEGLRAGDRIVLYGIQKVRPGVLVKPELVEAPSDPLSAETRQKADGDMTGDESAEQPAAKSAE